MALLIEKRLLVILFIYVIMLEIMLVEGFVFLRTQSSPSYRPTSEHLFDSSSRWRAQKLRAAVDVPPGYKSSPSSSSSSTYARKHSSSSSSSSGTIDLLYDSDCPICAMEVEFLKKRDIHHRIRFTDLSSDDYDPSDHGNVQFADGMRKIRAILPNEQIVTGVEVFRHTYDAIGLGWVFEATRYPLIGHMADAIYDFWAEHRLRITGRGDMADLLKERAEKLKEIGPIDECDLDACELFFDDEDDDEDMQAQGRK